MDEDFEAMPDTQAGDIGRRIESVIAQEESSATRAGLLRSIPGIGPVSAAMLIAEMPELGRMTAGEAAAMTGLAPLPHDSGTIRGRRAIAKGRRDKLGSDLSEFSRRKPDDWEPFDAGKAKSVLSYLPNGLTEGQFCQRLSLNPDLFHDLADGGILDEARCESGGGWDVIAGQVIVDRLLWGARQVGRLAPEWMSVEQAGVHFECASAEVLERIRDGRLPWLGRHLKQTGFASILVNMSGLDGAEISAETFALSQGLTFSEMLSFFRKGHSPAEIARRETGRKDRIMLTPTQVAGFHENFVSFRRFALAHRLSWGARDQRMEGFGIAPVDGCLRIYRKSEVGPLLHDVVPARQ